MMGRVELDPAKQSETHCEPWVEGLRDANLGRIDYGPDGVSKRTARWLGKKTGAATRSVENLGEVDIGLWAGLTVDQLKQRFETAYRELCEAPLHVSPPEGEPLADASERITAALRKRIRRNGVATIGFVLRPLAFALAQHALIPDFTEEDVWAAARAASEPVYIDIAALAAPSGSE